MGGSPELPRGWDPETGSLQDLVHGMFHDSYASTDDERHPPTTQPSPTVAVASPGRAQSAADREPAPPPRPPSSPAGLLRRRLAAPALTTAVLLAATLAGLYILDTTATTRASSANVSQVGATVTPPPAPSPAATSPTVAAPLPPPAVPAPEPVVIDFGTRSEVGDGWRLAASRPYPCDVLMAIPVLQQDGTRIVRVTLTLTNRTGIPQPTRVWRLAATADGTPAEHILWPSERFRGVPDTTLKPGRSVRFLVAIRVPEQRVQLRITAERDAAPGAVFAGAL